MSTWNYIASAMGGASITKSASQFNLLFSMLRDWPRSRSHVTCVPTGERWRREWRIQGRSMPKGVLAPTINALRFGLIGLVCVTTMYLLCWVGFSCANYCQSLRLTAYVPWGSFISRRVHGLRAKLLNAKRYKEKAAMKKTFVCVFVCLCVCASFAKFIFHQTMWTSKNPWLLQHQETPRAQQ